MLTLSICIPSYNRFEKLKETVGDILKAKSDDFEVVVVDNCSPRNIEDYIKFNDSRLKIIHRETAVRGEQNVNECVFYSNAKYALLLLDKDVIKGEYLDDFIDTLRNSEIAGGYCKLNSTNNQIKIEESNPILNFGYLSKHPSGNIYRSDFVKEFINQEHSIIEQDAFGFDFCMAYVASKGSMMLYDKPLVFSQLSNKPNGTKLEKSLSFNPKNNNVFYFPQNRIREFVLYIQYLDKLDIDKSIKIREMEKLYFSTISMVTLGYRGIMKDKFTCYHYGHEQKNVSLVEMIGNYKILNKTLVGLDTSFATKEGKRTMIRNSYKKIISKIIKKVRGL